MGVVFGGKAQKTPPGSAAPSTRPSTSSSFMEPRNERRKVEFDGKLIATEADNDENFYEYMQKMRDSICVEGEAAGVRPVRWEATGLSPDLMSNLKYRMRYNGLLPLQEHTIPILLHPNNYSILVQSPTGSGKTAAFGIPAVQIAMNFKQKNVGPKKKSGPSVVIICNTQNLAMQIRNNLVMIAGGEGAMNSTGINVFGMYSGGDDKRGMHKNCDVDIVVATMGNLIRSITNKFMQTHNIQLLVVDEADKMISLNAFGPDVEKILQAIDPGVREKMKVAAFSATYEVDRDGAIDYGSGVLGELFNHKRPSEIKVESVKGFITQRIILIQDNGMSVSSAGMDQRVINRKIFENTTHNLKVNWLIALMKKDKAQYFINGKFTKTAVIFVERIVTCNFLSSYLMYLGYNVLPLNSNYDLHYVNETLKKMANGQIQAVISTNKLARGQDVPGLHHVIVYEMSSEFSDYQHRIGRTGRIGHGGIATVLFSAGKDMKHAPQLYGFMREHNQKIPRWLHEQALLDQRQRVEQTGWGDVAEF